MSHSIMIISYQYFFTTLKRELIGLCHYGNGSRLHVRAGFNCDHSQNITKYNYKALHFKTF